MNEEINKVPPKEARWIGSWFFIEEGVVKELKEGVVRHLDVPGCETQSPNCPPRIEPLPVLRLKIALSNSGVNLVAMRYPS
jgi:hypothetical protein